VNLFLVFLSNNPPFSSFFFHYSYDVIRNKTNDERPKESEVAPIKEFRSSAEMIFLWEQTLSDKLSFVTFISHQYSNK